MSDACGTLLQRRGKKVGFLCVANSEEKLIRGVAVAETVNTEDTATSGEFKKTGNTRTYGNGYPKVI